MPGMEAWTDGPDGRGVLNPSPSPASAVTYLTREEPPRSVAIGAKACVGAALVD
jgi:hypothetical protein